MGYFLNNNDAHWMYARNPQDAQSGNVKELINHLNSLRAHNITATIFNGATFWIDTEQQEDSDSESPDSQDEAFGGQVKRYQIMYVDENGEIKY